MYVIACHGRTGLPNVQSELGRCFLIWVVIFIRNAIRFETNGAQSGQSWLNAFQRNKMN